MSPISPSVDVARGSFLDPVAYGWEGRKFPVVCNLLKELIFCHYQVIEK